MKQASNSARQGMLRRVLVLALGLLACGLLLLSCAKKTATSPSSPPTDQGYAITSQPAQSLPGKVVQHAMGTECQSNLDQIRQLIMIYRSDNNGENPPSLSALQVPAKLLHCPISHNDYTYDPATGEVHCTFPGHEQF